MKDLPWFKCFPAELLMDTEVLLWEPAVKGYFFELYLLCWESGLPNDPEQLGRLLRVQDPVQFSSVWGIISHRFRVVEIDGRERLFETRLYELRCDALEKCGEGSNSKSAAAKKGWENHKARAEKQPKGTKRRRTQVAPKPDFPGFNEENADAFHAGARSESVSASDSGSDFDSVVASKSDKVSADVGCAEVALQTTFDDPNPQPDEKVARALANRMCKVRARGADANKVVRKHVDAFEGLFLDFLRAGYTGPNLELMLRWAEEDPSGRQAWTYNMNELPVRGKVHPLEVKVVPFIERARAWAERSPNGNLLPAAGAEVIAMTENAASSAVELETWWARARSRFAEMISPDLFAARIDPISLSGAVLERDGTLVAVVTASTWEAFHSNRENTYAITDVLKDTAPGTRPARFRLQFDPPDLPLESEEHS